MSFINTVKPLLRHRYLRRRTERTAEDEDFAALGLCALAFFSFLAGLSAVSFLREEREAEPRREREVFFSVASSSALPSRA